MQGEQAKVSQYEKYQFYALELLLPQGVLNFMKEVFAIYKEIRTNVSSITLNLVELTQRRGVYVVIFSTYKSICQAHIREFIVLKGL